MVNYSTLSLVSSQYELLPSPLGSGSIITYLDSRFSDVGLTDLGLWLTANNRRTGRRSVIGVSNEGPCYLYYNNICVDSRTLPNRVHTMYHSRFNYNRNNNNKPISSGSRSKS